MSELTEEGVQHLPVRSLFPHNASKSTLMRFPVRCEQQINVIARRRKIQKSSKNVTRNLNILNIFALLFLKVNFQLIECIEYHSMGIPLIPLVNNEFDKKTNDDAGFTIKTFQTYLINLSPTLISPFLPSDIESIKNRLDDSVSIRLGTTFTGWGSISGYTEFEGLNSTLEVFPNQDISRPRSKSENSDRMLQASTSLVYYGNAKFYIPAYGSPPDPHLINELVDKALLEDLTFPLSTGIDTVDSITDATFIERPSNSPILFSRTTNFPTLLPTSYPTPDTTDKPTSGPVRFFTPVSIMEQTNFPVPFTARKPVLAPTIATKSPTAFPTLYHKGGSKEKILQDVPRSQIESDGKTIFVAGVTSGGAFLLIIVLLVQRSRRLRDCGDKEKINTKQVIDNCSFNGNVGSPSTKSKKLYRLARGAGNRKSHSIRQNMEEVLDTYWGDPTSTEGSDTTPTTRNFCDTDGILQDWSIGDEGDMGDLEEQTSTNIGELNMHFATSNAYAAYNRSIEMYFGFGNGLEGFDSHYRSNDDCQNPDQFLISSSTSRSLENLSSVVASTLSEQRHPNETKNMET